MVVLGLSAAFIVSLSFLVYYKQQQSQQHSQRSSWWSALPRFLPTALVVRSANGGGVKTVKGQNQAQAPDIVVGDGEKGGDRAISEEEKEGEGKQKQQHRDREAMPPPAAPRPTPPSIQPATVQDGHVQPPTTSTASSSQHLTPPLRGPPRLNPLPPATVSRPPSFNTNNPSMPPPPRPSTTTTSRTAALTPSTSSLRVPTTASTPGTSSLSASTQAPPSRPRQKVLLAPGHSPLDWARLQRDPSTNLRNLPHDRLLRISPAQLRAHSGRRRRKPSPSTPNNSTPDPTAADAWTVLNTGGSTGAGGIPKVYNITPYLPFHPGGEAELMRAAGKDGTKLFMEIHSWVNWEGMLDGCLVGVLVGEGEGDGETATATGQLRNGVESGGGTGMGREWDEVD